MTFLALALVADAAGKMNPKGKKRGGNSNNNRRAAPQKAQGPANAKEKESDESMQPKNVTARVITKSQEILEQIKTQMKECDKKKAEKKESMSQEDQEEKKKFFISVSQIVRDISDLPQSNQANKTELLNKMHILRQVEAKLKEMSPKKESQSIESMNLEIKSSKPMQSEKMMSRNETMKEKKECAIEKKKIMVKCKELLELVEAKIDIIEKRKASMAERMKNYEEKKESPKGDDKPLTAVMEEKMSKKIEELKEMAMKVKGIAKMTASDGDKKETLAKRKAYLEKIEDCLLYTSPSPRDS